jgi:hypothetical protein
MATKLGRLLLYWASWPFLTAAMLVGVTAAKLLLWLFFPVVWFRRIAKQDGYLVAVIVLVIGGLPLVGMLIGVYKVLTGQLPIFRSGLF